MQCYRVNQSFEEERQITMEGPVELSLTNLDILTENNNVNNGNCDTNVRKNDEKSKLEWRKHLKTLLATLCAALGAICLGTVFGYSAPAIPDINSGYSSFHLSEKEVAWVVSVSSLGGLFGGPLGGMFLDRIGRKTTLLFATIPFVFGWLLITISTEVYCLCIGRLLTGASAGVMDVSVPVYISEISAPEVRGFMGSCHELSTNIGLLYAFAFGIFLHWTWLAVACQAIPTIMLICLIFVPESPRWLLRRGKRQACIRNLKWLRGENENINEELNSLTGATQEEPKVGWSEFKKSDVYRPLLTIMGLMLFQQMSGYGAIPQYMVSILETAGSSWDPNSQTAVVGALGVLANLLSATVVDKVGRRFMLLTSASIMTFSLIALSVYLTLNEFYLKVDVSRYSIVAFVCIVIYNMSVALGYGPIPFYLASELLPLRVRGKAGGIAISSVWLFSFITSYAFPYIVELIGLYGIFWVMSAFAGLSIIYAYIVVPETKGLSLEEIEKKNT